MREAASRALDPWILPTLLGTLILAAWCGKNRCTGRSALTKDDTQVCGPSLAQGSLSFSLSAWPSASSAAAGKSASGGGDETPAKAAQAPPEPAHLPTSCGPKMKRLFCFFTGNQVWFQKETRKGIQDFTSMKMSKKQETRVHISYLTCTLRRHKCQHSKAPTWSSSHFLLAVRAETEAAPMAKLLKPSTIFIPTATVKDVLLLPTHGWGD